VAEELVIGAVPVPGIELVEFPGMEYGGVVGPEDDVELKVMVGEKAVPVPEGMVVFPLEMGKGGLVEEDFRLSDPVLGAVDPVPAESDDELDMVGLAVTAVPVPGMLEVELPLGIGYGAELDIEVLTAVPVPGMLDVALLVGIGYGAEELIGTLDDELLARAVEEELEVNVPGDLGTVAPVPPGVDGEGAVEEVTV